MLLKLQMKNLNAYCCGTPTTIQMEGSFSFHWMEGAFITALALPGDNVKPQDFKAFLVENGKGLYIHPNVWHEAIVPLTSSAKFYDEQGAVHGRVSVHFPKEFGVFLSISIV